MRPAQRVQPAARNGAQGHGHKHVAGHEHEFEPVRGLPEALPEGEQILWQGSPQWQALARRAFHVRKLLAYFSALVVLRLVLMEDASLTAMAVSALWMALLGAVAVGSLLFVAWLSARTAVYTITDKRVVMRVGIVLTLTFNIPFKRLSGAGLHLQADGSGDLPLALSGDDRIAWLNLWPHVRPWRLARPEPMLRAVPDAAAVAQLLTEAWSRHTGLAATPAAEASPEAHHGGQPALAGR